MKRAKDNESLLLDICEKICNGAIDIKKLMAPWDKISKLNDKLFNLEPPKKCYNYDFIIEYKKKIGSLKDEINSLYEYAVTPYMQIPDDKKRKAYMLERNQQDDYGFSRIYKDEYEYITNLEKALFYLELCFIQNTKVSTLWTQVTKLKENSSNTVTLRKFLFLEICRLKSFIYIFSLKEINQRKKLKRSQSLQDFPQVVALKLAVPVLSIENKYSDDSNSLWMIACESRDFLAQRIVQHSSINMKNSNSSMNNDNNSMQLDLGTDSQKKTATSSNTSSSSSSVLKNYQSFLRKSKQSTTSSQSNSSMDISDDEELSNNNNNSSNSSSRGGGGGGIVNRIANESNSNSSRSPSALSKYLQSNNSSIKRTPMLVEKPKLILLYTQTDLEEAFRFLLYRWKSVNYHLDIDNYVKLLLIRASMIMTFKNYGVEFANGFSNKGHDNDDVDLENLYLNFKDITFYDYQYKMEVRFYYILEKLSRFHSFRKLTHVQLENENLKFNLYYESEALTATKTHALITQFLIDLTTKWASSQMGRFQAGRVRKRYMELLVPVGDKEWLEFISPTEPLTVTNILEKLHDNIYEMISKEANTPLSTILSEKSASIVKLHDEIVLTSVEMLFSDTKDISNGFSFIHNFYYNEINEDRLINTNKILKEPFLAVLFSKILVHYQVPCSHLKNIKESNLILLDSSNQSNCKQLVLTCVTNDSSIYHVIATLLILLKRDFPQSKKTTHMWQKLMSNMNK